MRSAAAPGKAGDRRCSAGGAHTTVTTRICSAVAPRLIRSSSSCASVPPAHNSHMSKHSQDIVASFGCCPLQVLSVQDGSTR